MRASPMFPVPTNPIVPSIFIGLIVAPGRPVGASRLRRALTLDHDLELLDELLAVDRP